MTTFLEPTPLERSREILRALKEVFSGSSQLVIIDEEGEHAVNDMRHMNHLLAVAVSDVSHLREKEKTYQGSWKKRGGIGAFMMLARKWDRLEGIIARGLIVSQSRIGKPNVEVGAYDVFGFIESQPGSGEDGTVLAEIRDLRRYLMLVEAEMMARGMKGSGEDIYETMADAVGLDRKKVREAFHSIMYGGVGGAGGTGEVGSFTDRVTRTFPPFIETPKVAGGEVFFHPWVYTREDLTAAVPNAKHRETLWQSWSQRRCALEPALSANDLEVLRHEQPVPAVTTALTLYTPIDGGGAVLNLNLAPPDTRDLWPVLRRELNEKERFDLPQWQQSLYYWHEAGTKWILKKENECWLGE